MHLLVGILFDLFLDGTKLGLLVITTSLELVDVISELLLVCLSQCVLPGVEGVTLQVSLDAVVGSIEELLAKFVHPDVLDPTVPAVLLVCLGPIVFKPFALLFDILSTFFCVDLASVLVKCRS